MNLELLRKLKDKFSAEGALFGMVQNLLPKFEEHLAGLENPDTGLLKEGEDKIGYLITRVSGKVQISLVPMTFDGEQNRMYLGKPLKAGGLDTLLTKTTEQKHGNDQSNPTTES